LLGKKTSEALTDRVHAVNRHLEKAILFSTQRTSDYDKLMTAVEFQRSKAHYDVFLQSFMSADFFKEYAGLGTDFYKLLVFDEFQCSFYCLQSIKKVKVKCVLKDCTARLGTHFSPSVRRVGAWGAVAVRSKRTGWAYRGTHSLNGPCRCVALLRVHGCEPERERRQLDDTDRVLFNGDDGEAAAPDGVPV
jgi:hypothetical protein